ncbi:MAG: Ku protein [Sphingobacteriales bacterium]|nr:MAG: Ku protein [Sphingobacteriales bacterium]
MRAIWTGAIGFGLVNIPIRIFSATQSSTLDLDMLDKKDHANIRFQRVNESTGRKVEWGDIVKGYKYDGDYVIVTDEDFEKASPEKSKMIGINEFVKEEQISSLYYESPYYLEPSKGGEKAYALLRDALKQSGKVALGSYVMRTKENFCMLKAQDDMLVLMKLRFPEEIRKPDELQLPAKAEVKAAEIKMAIALINQLTPKKFNIYKYKDTYTEALMKVIEAKAKGKKITQPKFKMVHNKTKDLMAQLKESIETRKRAS